MCEYVWICIEYVWICIENYKYIVTNCILGLLPQPPLWKNPSYVLITRQCGDVLFQGRNQKGRDYDPFLNIFFKLKFHILVLLKHHISPLPFILSLIRRRWYGIKRIREWKIVEKRCFTWCIILTQPQGFHHFFSFP